MPAALRPEGALHLLRHHPAGDAIRRARGARDLALHRPRALRAPVPLRDLDHAEAAPLVLCLLHERGLQRPCRSPAECAPADRPGALEPSLQLRHPHLAIPGRDATTTITGTSSSCPSSRTWRGSNGARGSTSIPRRPRRRRSFCGKSSYEDPVRGIRGSPFAKTGGLADVAGSLPPALASLGHDVRRGHAALPAGGHACIKPASRSQPSRCRSGHGRSAAMSFEGRMDANVIVYFIKKDIYFDRPELYRTAQGDYPDNAERFIFFSRAVLELCRALDFTPDIIHCNDWQTGLIPLYLRTTVPRRRNTSQRTRTVFTVHNLGYQGIFWHWDMRSDRSRLGRVHARGHRVLGQDQFSQGRPRLLGHHHDGEQDLQPRDPDP